MSSEHPTERPQRRRSVGKAVNIVVFIYLIHAGVRLVFGVLV